MRCATVLTFFLITLFAAPTFAQEPPAAAQPRPEILVLGVYHMANPGRDIFNTKADDVLAPKRQAEMIELVNVLAKFRPTKIAVERDPRDERIQKPYADYLAGTHQLTSNEVEQIGFRLAKQLGHAKVYGVNVDGEFPYPRLAKYAKATGRTKEFDALNDAVAAMVKANDAYLASHSILETLLRLNSEEHIAEEVGYYYRQAEFGEPYDWAGADLLSDWFRRNMRIYSNIVQLIESPSERVLVIYGSGHAGWLRDPVLKNPTLRLRRLEEFAR